jgi:hypothetical protein
MDAARLKPRGVHANTAVQLLPCTGRPFYNANVRVDKHREQAAIHKC